MSASPITQNLLWLNRLRLVNAYLVREDDGFTLVDTMIPGSAQGILESARQAGGEIRRIAITHCHTDHVGSVDALKQRLGDSVELLIPEIDYELVTGQRTVEPKPPGGWPKLKSTPDRQLKPGDRVGSLEVVPTPGHTPGHVAFLDTRDRAVIAGDVFVTLGGLTVTNHFHLVFPFAAMATWDKAQDLQSAKDVRALNPSLVTVGHGPPARDPAAALEKAIAAAGG